MIEYGNIGSLFIYIESLIEKTLKDKLLWVKIEDDKFIKKYVAIVDIPKTKKYLKISINELILTSEYSYMKTEFHIKNNNKVIFNDIDCKENRKLNLLINVVKKQLK